MDPGTARRLRLAARLEHPWDLTVPNDVTRDIYERAGFALPHGHNFFVDVLPELPASSGWVSRC